MTDADFNGKLEKLTSKMKNMLRHLRGADKATIDRKYQKLLTVINDFALLKLSGGFRRAPFGIEFFGRSSVGKTTACDQLSNILLASAGLSTDKGRTFTFDPAKKFWDKAKSDMLRFHCDDHANTKEKYVEKSPCETIVQVKNNVPLCAPMAEIENKGKVWVEPELLTVTTNVLHLDAHIYSNCPYSIQRRMDVVLDVKVKDKYAVKRNGVTVGLDSGKVQEGLGIGKDGYTPSPYDDIWEFDVLTPVMPENLTQSGIYELVEWNDIVMKGVDFQTVINYAIEKFHTFRQRQFNMKHADNKRIVHYDLCGIDGCCQLKGKCMRHITPQWGEEIATSIRMAKNIITGQIEEELSRPARMLELGAAGAIRAQAVLFYRYFNWVSLVPSQWLHNPLVENALFFLDSRRVARQQRRIAMHALAVGTAAIGACVKYTNRGRLRRWGCVYLASCTGTYIFYRFSRAKETYLQYLEDANTISPILRSYRDQYMPYVLAAAGSIGAAYAMAKVYAAWKKLNPQGSLEPKTQEEVDQRDAEKSPWTTVLPRELPVSDLNRTMTKEQLKNAVLKNLVYGTISYEGVNYMVNGLFIKSNVVIIPRHYFEIDGKLVDSIDVTFRKKNPETSGGKFATRLSPQCSWHIPGTDFMVCYSSTGGSFKDIVPYFALDHMPNHPFNMYYRQKNGEVLEATGTAKLMKVFTCCEFIGHKYTNLSMDTFSGLCGAVLIANTSAPVISGLHLGGQCDSPIGCSGSLTVPQLTKALKEIRQCEGVLITGSAEKFEPQVLGVKICSPGMPHKKSPLNYMPQNSQVEYYGQCPGRAKYVSRVRVTEVSETVTEVTGVPNKWGPPKMSPDWYGWQTCLANLAVPATPYEYRLLQLAVKDYKRSVIPLFQNKLWFNCAPLNDRPNINGWVGLKFIDAIKMSTAIGLPLSGPKSKYILDMDAQDEWGMNREFTPEVMGEVDRCENCYRNGERAFPVAKACKKDEVLSKDKCRIFYGNAVALTFLIRKYFLPILRVIMMNPLKSECAVGINCHGPEWDQFYNHVMKFGSQRIFVVITENTIKRFLHS
jgi:hypothetical protein